MPIDRFRSPQWSALAFNQTLRRTVGSEQGGLVEHEPGRAAHVGRTLAESAPMLSTQWGSQEGSPNVVVILLDDLGFAELGCYGSNIATPNIDRLATGGLRYNNFHVTPLCSPTRACLLTGRNHHAVSMGFLSDFPMGFPGYIARIPKSAGTLPRILREAGYSTFAVGKWHLTPPAEASPSGPFDRWPLGLGFERYYGFLEGWTNQWTPDLVCDNGFIAPPSSPYDGYHLTEDLTNRAIRLILDQRNPATGKPFFLYFAPGAMHFPHQSPKAYIDRYRNQFIGGWQEERNRTFLRQREMDVIPSNTVLTERPPCVSPWKHLSSSERLIYARQMEAYAGFLTHTDAQIGRLIDSLETIGALQNTILLVMSDNGAAPGGPRGTLDYTLSTNDVKSMLDGIEDFGGFRSLNNYALGWAWCGNTPFKLWKSYTWLGGVRVPLIVHWPAGIPKDQSGKIRTQFCHAIDLMPTILDATDVESPDILDGVSQQLIDGKSIRATFCDGLSQDARSTQYFEMGGSRAIYHDGWKATTNHVYAGDAVDGSDDFDTDQWSLFCLKDDFAEARDLAHAHPDRLRKMIDLWWYEAGRNQALPLTDDLVRAEGADRPLVYPQHHSTIIHPDDGPIATPFLGGGFGLTVSFAIPDNTDAAGVICAQGNWHAGWACYFLEGYLVVTFVFDRTESRFRIDEVLQTGGHELEIAYRPDARDGGCAKITLDREEIGGGRVSIRSSAVAAVSLFGKLLIGRDQGFPVCHDDYRTPFPFNGHIDSAVFEVPMLTDKRYGWERFNIFGD